jgi:hypothetical protein
MLGQGNGGPDRGSCGARERMKQEQSGGAMWGQLVRRKLQFALTSLRWRAGWTLGAGKQATSQRATEKGKVRTAAL